jgi:serine/threonine protein kinase
MLRDGEYCVQRVLGHGGMGKVYLTTHTALQIPFALKQARADQPLPESVITELDYVLQGGDLAQRTCSDQGQEAGFPATGGTHTDRFLREALLLTRLQHPAIPTLYDYFFEDGFWYLVMDYIPGPTLSHYLRQHAPLAPLEALNYAIQICDVLDYLHQQAPSIIFRDLKPSNLILTPEGALMLVDFGIARYFKTGQINDTMDLGSPGYASPEQYQGEGQTDGRSDLFSLGIILQEMLTGKRPSMSGSTLTPLPHEAHQPLSSPMRGLIALATRLEPEQRFQSAHALYLALERVYAIEEKLAYQHQIDKTERTQAMTQPTLAPQMPEEETTIDEQSESTAPSDLDIMDLVEQVPMGPIPIKTAKPTGLQAYPMSDDLKAARNTLPVIPTPSFNLELRHQTRMALQQARRERLKEENLEIQLASVDESLKRRSLVLHTQSSQALKKTPTSTTERSQAAPQARPRVHRLLKVCFLLALLLCLLLTSLVTYMRFARPALAPVRSGRHVSTSPTSVATWEGTWQILPSPPSAEADNSAIYVQSQGRAYVYMSGGYRGAQSSPHYDRGLYRYDIMTAHWEAASGTHFPGMLNNAVAQDEHGQLFFTAGYSTDSYKVAPLLYMYQPADGSLRTIRAPASITFGFAAAMLADQQGHLYLTQGYQKAGDPAAQAGRGWYRYDIASGKWHRLAPLPVGLGYVLLANNAHGDILMLGGATDAGQAQQSKQIYRYDIGHNRWQEEALTLPYPFSGATSCRADPGHIVVIGGYDAAHKQGLRETWLVDMQTGRWIALAPLPRGGSVLGSAACDGHGHVYLVRGASDPSHPTADYWLLSIQRKEGAP